MLGLTFFCILLHINPSIYLSSFQSLLSFSFISRSITDFNTHSPKYYFITSYNSILYMLDTSVCKNHIFHEHFL